MMALFSEYSRPDSGSLRRKELISRLALHVLMDREWSRGRDMFNVASAALEGGATVIQLRDKKASTRQLVEEGLVLRRLTDERGALLIVNDRIDVALAVDADGAHVGQDDDMPVQLARKLLGSDRILGVSAGNQAEAAAAMATNVDYISVGPIYATRAKSDAGPPIGTQLLAELAASTTTPLVAIGGITARNVDAVVQSGAIGVAVITAVVSAEDIALATRNILHALQAYHP